ncbi:hypothetical protein NPIL_696761 [Nephila pilipes]|uniref:Uncharacterized protein n=1 Tax=Nephila pilipes TaxID=299642 RepID=A0A8X6QXJ8_NEPPI|nr:hypothetical protein NPIL_696761 [Nephila pilipes]
MLSKHSQLSHATCIDGRAPSHLGVLKTSFHFKSSRCHRVQSPEGRETSWSLFSSDLKNFDQKSEISRCTGVRLLQRHQLPCYQSQLDRICNLSFGEFFCSFFLKRRSSRKA